MRSPRPMVAKESPLAEVEEKSPAKGHLTRSLPRTLSVGRLKLAAGKTRQRCEERPMQWRPSFCIKDQEAKVLKGKLIQIEKERAAAALAAQTPTEELPDPNVGSWGLCSS